MRQTLPMTLARAWTLEMTDDRTHTRITEHDKDGVLQSTHFNSSLAHITARPSQAKVGARKKSSTPLWRTRQEKNAVERPFHGSDSCNEKKKEKVQPKTKTPRPQTLQLRSSLAGPRMALRPGRRTTPSARLSPSRKILPFRKCTPQQPLHLATRLRRDLIMACGDQFESRRAACD